MPSHAQILRMGSDRHVAVRMGSGCRPPESEPFMSGLPLNCSTSVPQFLYLWDKAVKVLLPHWIILRVISQQMESTGCVRHQVSAEGLAVRVGILHRLQGQRDRLCPSYIVCSLSACEPGEWEMSTLSPARNDHLSKSGAQSLHLCPDRHVWDLTTNFACVPVFLLLLLFFPISLVTGISRNPHELFPWWPGGWFWKPTPK